MGENNQNNNQNVQPQTNEQDPRLIQPEIIGELRKDKIGKPILVIELFLLFGIVFAALPFINSQLTDEESQLYKLLHGEGFGGDVVVTTTQAPGEDEFLDGSEVNLLQSDSKIRYKNIVLKDIQVNNNSISLTMYALTGTVNLDESEYYLDVASSSGNILTSLKLTGEYDNVETPVVLDAGKTSFNSTMSYTGQIVEMKDADYPEVELTQDELGYAQMVCKKDSRVITYGFKNNYLIKINDEEYVKVKSTTSDKYMNALDSARKKAAGLGTEIANVEEVNDGFKYSANIDLSGEYQIPKSVVDYNYYPTNTLVKKIKYAQKGKGYDCE